MLINDAAEIQTAGRILVIDDEPDIVRPCVRALTMQGYEAQGASGGREALALVEREPFDLLLLDLKMPDMDGLEVLRQAKEMRPGVEAIIISGYGTLETAIEAMRLGALDFVTKPFDLKHIVAKTQQALEYTSETETGVHGNLRSMSLTSIISINCNEGTLAALEIQHAGQRAVLFFEKGDIVHATLNGQTGAEVVYQALAWEEGDFNLNMGQSAPERTIHTGWSGLLLEGLRRIDKAAFDQEQLPPELESEIQESVWPQEFDEPLPISQQYDAFAPTKGKRTISFDWDDDTQTRVEERLAQLHRDLEPRCILLTNRSGRVLNLQGGIGPDCALSLAALVAGSFSATDEIAEILAREKEDGRFQQSLQEGSDFSLYVVKVGLDLILAVVFAPELTSLGLARQFTLQAAETLATLASQVGAVPIEALQQEATVAMDDIFLQGVDDALGDLFG